jgi:hypothetical protein
MTGDDAVNAAFGLRTPAMTPAAAFYRPAGTPTRFSGPARDSVLAPGPE